jgi:hypothetical protein
MADGGWIKMRAWLIDSPKVIAISRILQGSPEFMAWAGLLRETRNDVLRLSATSLLMKVWSVARESGRDHGKDLLLPFITIDDIDTLAGCPSFGKAMQIVEWAVPSDDPQGVLLPNFSDMTPPKTPAERMKDSRSGVLRKPRNKCCAESATNVAPRAEQNRVDQNSIQGNSCEPLFLGVHRGPQLASELLSLAESDAPIFAQVAAIVANRACITLDADTVRTIAASAKDKDKPGAWFRATVAHRVGSKRSLEELLARVVLEEPANG